MVELALGTGFVPNDVHLDCTENQVVILTGPNMAGKSTYMRQVALIVIMAQIGSFVPAKYASIGIVDRVFTRVGAFDDIISGQSTFMVEMVELANILNCSTRKSLIILDEIGRGTSTFDGLSIAWAIVMFIHDKIGAKTLFATHYHHLTELSRILKRIKNFHIAVKEEKDDIIFLRKVVPGSTDKSYGIQVAKLAGIPFKVVRSAKNILKRIEQENITLTQHEKPNKRKIRYTQVMLFDTDSMVANPVLEEIRNLDLNNLTPTDALIKLQEFQRKLQTK
jgi:DNA mismatch repair protein MutS